jgi:hypothetical protein
VLAVGVAACRGDWEARGSYDLGSYQGHQDNQEAAGIVTAILTGVTNATSESLNRIAKLEARLAYGFRNPANQRGRVRIACTRGTRRQSPTATSTTKQPVINREQVPD